MLPRFKTLADWEQAELLMQPCLIRVIDNLRKELESSPYKGTYHEVTEPIPGHEILLNYQGNSLVFNVWDLCFQVCFLNYHASQEEEVVIDPKLLEKSGQIDWHALEDKTKAVIRDIFIKLPQPNDSSVDLSH